MVIAIFQPNPALAPPNRVGPGMVFEGTITGPILADDYLVMLANVTVIGNVIEAFGARHVLGGHTFWVLMAQFGPTGEWPPAGGTVDITINAFHAAGGGAFDTGTFPAFGVLDYQTGIANLLNNTNSADGSVLGQILAAVTKNFPSLP